LRVLGLDDTIGEEREAVAGQGVDQGASDKASPLP
jgi:hypothetical protein